MTSFIDWIVFFIIVDRDNLDPVSVRVKNNIIIILIKWLSFIIPIMIITIIKYYLYIHQYYQKHY